MVGHTFPRALGLAAAVATTLALAACSHLNGTSTSAGDTNGVVLNGKQSGQGSAAATTAPPRAVSLKAVLKAVKAAPKITSVPPNLSPPLASLPGDVPTLGSEGCLAPDPATSIKLCVYGDKTSSKIMLVYGDSHASMWETALNLIGLRTGWRVIVLAKPGCPVPDLEFYDTTKHVPYTACTKWHGWAEKRIAQLKPKLLLLTSLTYYPTNYQKQVYTPAQWATGMAALVKHVRSAAKRIVLLGDIPYPTQDVPSCLAAHMSNVKTCSVPLSKAITPITAAEKSIAHANEIGYINPEKWICTSVCWPIVRTMGVYYNQYHLSATYVRFISGALQAALRLK